MKYDVLPQKEAQSPASEDFENDQHHPPQRRVSGPIVTQIALSVATLVCVLLFFSVFMLQGRPQCAAQDNGWNVTRPYGRENTSRMSLDHEHDDLWSAFELMPAFGAMSKDNPDTSGMISMYVFGRWPGHADGC